MCKNAKEMSMDELLALADKNAIDQCDYCSYRLDCNHCAVNCYGGNPVESPCVNDPDKWVDEDELIERIQDILDDEEVPTMDQLLDKVLEIHRLGVEINKHVHTCNCGDLITPWWHIMGYENFIKVAEALNGGMFSEVDTGSGPYRWRYQFECRGVEVFCLSHERREVPTPAED